MLLAAMKYECCKIYIFYVRILVKKYSSKKKIIVIKYKVHCRALQSYDIYKYSFSTFVLTHSNPPLDEVWDPNQVGSTPHPTVDRNAPARRPKNYTYKYHF